ncbi:MAG: RND transporter [Gammaproteobacteria bacterium]|nr:RND transporter [Gammaproteobacteria bacterium]
MMKWVDKMPLFPLAVVAVFMGVLPLHGTSHLLEKIDMLQAGVLERPIDIFDLFLHGTPAALLVVRVIRGFVLGIKVDPENAADKESQADKK